MACPTRCASGKHTATLIFLHGLGDTGDGWLSNFSVKCRDLNHIKIMCPNAPTAAVSLNFGMKMPSWFDIKSLKFDAEEDEAGIIASSDRLKHIIDDEIKAGIPSTRIVVGGFSQGGAVGLHTLMTYEKKLAGFIGLSTFLPLHTKFASMRNKENKETKIFLGHGTADGVVDHTFGELTEKVLKTYYGGLKFYSYKDMGHSSCPKEMDDVYGFLKTVLKP